MEEFKAHINKAKEDAVAALREEFAGYDGYIFTDYRGMTASPYGVHSGIFQAPARL